MARWRLLCACLVVVAGAAIAASPREDIFSSYAPLSLTLRAPFEELTSQTSRHRDAPVPGTIAVNGERALDVEVSARGNTSTDTDECSFPKLKVHFRDRPDSGPFAGLSTLKIGTHCGDRPDGELTKKFGRLANPKSPHREAFVYRLLGVMGIPTLRARPVEVTYIPSAGQGASDASPFVRPAFLLEDDSDAKKRLSADEEIEPADFDTAQATFSDVDVARVLFAEAMIGNFDWCLKLSPTDTYRCDADKKLWNVVALRRRDGSTIPLIYDFDLAGMVTGRHSWFERVYTTAFVPTGSATDVEVLSQVQRTRTVLPRAALDEARRGFLERKDAAFRALDDADVDAEGIEFIRHYLASFFRDIGSDGAFYIPVVATRGVTAFRDAAAAQPACGPQSALPIGTPVSQPVDRSGQMVQVRLLDVHWHWTGQARCDLIRTDPVWIRHDAITAEYPK